MSIKLKVEGLSIGIIRVGDEDYFSITDIAKFRTEEPNIIIRSWISSKDTLAFLSVWETLNNQNFDLEGHENASKDAGSRAFSISPSKWIENTRAIGIVSKPGRTGGTYGHSDIAFEFASWISPEFRLYIITEYKRLKQLESLRSTPEWKLQREIAKLNYRVQTDAIKDNLILPGLSKEQVRFTYADEADLLNVVVFGATAKQWRENNPELSGNLRDYASYAQLLVIGNLQAQNAALIDSKIPQEQRMSILRNVAVRQLRSLESVNASARLSALESGEENDK